MARLVRTAALTVLIAALITGCTTTPDSVDPVVWYATRTDAVLSRGLGPEPAVDGIDTYISLSFVDDPDSSFLLISTAAGPSMLPPEDSERLQEVVRKRLHHVSAGVGEEQVIAVVQGAFSRIALATALRRGGLKRLESGVWGAGGIRVTWLDRGFVLIEFGGCVAWRGISPDGIAESDGSGGDGGNRGGAEAAPDHFAQPAWTLPPGIGAAPGDASSADATGAVRSAGGAYPFLRVRGGSAPALPGAFVLPVERYYGEVRNAADGVTEYVDLWLDLSDERVARSALVTLRLVLLRIDGIEALNGIDSDAIVLERDGTVLHVTVSAIEMERIIHFLEVVNETDGS